MAHRRITAYEKTCPAMLLRHVSIFDMRAGSPIFSYQNYMTLYTKLSDALQPRWPPALTVWPLQRKAPNISTLSTRACRVCPCRSRQQAQDGVSCAKANGE